MAKTRSRRQSLGFIGADKIKSPVTQCAPRRFKLAIFDYFFGEAAGLAAVFASFLAPFSALAAFTSILVAVML